MCAFHSVTSRTSCKVVFSLIVFSFVPKDLPTLSAVRHFSAFRKDVKQAKEPLGFAELIFCLLLSLVVKLNNEKWDFF